MFNEFLVRSNAVLLRIEIDGRMVRTVHRQVNCYNHHCVHREFTFGKVIKTVYKHVNFCIHHDVTSVFFNFYSFVVFMSVIPFIYFSPFYDI